MVYGRSGPDKEIEIGKMGGQSILRKTAVSRKALISIVFIDDFKAHPTLVRASAKAIFSSVHVGTNDGILLFYG